MRAQHKRLKQVGTATAYWRGVECIALNDEPSESRLVEVSEMLTVGVLAEAFGIEPRTVAVDVLQVRLDANLI